MSAKRLHSSLVHQQMSVLNGRFTQQGLLQPSAPDCRPNPQSIWHWEMNVNCSRRFLYAVIIFLPSGFFTLTWRFQDSSISLDLKKIIPWQNKSIKSFTKIIVMLFYLYSLSGLTEEWIVYVQWNNRKWECGKLDSDPGLSQGIISWTNQSSLCWLFHRWLTQIRFNHNFFICSLARKSTLSNSFCWGHKW